MKALLADYRDIFSRFPGRSKVAKQVITTGLSKPVRCAPFGYPLRNGKWIAAQVAEWFAWEL